MTTTTDYINMSEEQFDQLTHDELTDSYTDHVNLLGDYVMKMNNLDYRRKKIINILKQRAGEDFDKEDVSSSDDESEPEYDNINIIDNKNEKIKKTKKINEKVDKSKKTKKVIKEKEPEDENCDNQKQKKTKKVIKEKEPESDDDNEKQKKTKKVTKEPESDDDNEKQKKTKKVTKESDSDDDNEKQKKTKKVTKESDSDDDNEKQKKSKKITKTIKKVIKKVVEEPEPEELCPETNSDSEKEPIKKGRQSKSKSVTKK